MISATKSAFFERLKKSQISISCILDVGVNYGTPELKKHFPDLPHLLFEPSPIFHEPILREYSNISHTLYKCALSDSNGKLYLIESALKKDGVITHTQISDNPREVDGFDIVSSTEIDVHRLDDLVLNNEQESYLLKIDIDGQDIKVLEGGKGIMKNVSVIVIEAQVEKIAETILSAEKYGFILVDIIDRCYYGLVLWQADLAFINKAYLNEEWTLKPWKSWDVELWKEVS